MIGTKNDQTDKKKVKIEDAKKLVAAMKTYVTCDLMFLSNFE